MDARNRIRAVALFDLSVTLPLAVPVVGEWWVAILLSGAGLFESPAHYLPLSVAAIVFTHLAGILGVLWNGARALHPLPWLTRMDYLGRIAVAACFAYLVLLKGAPAILWLFVCTEIVGAVIEYDAVRRMNSRPAARTPGL